MKTVKIEELKKGDLILVKWYDASEVRTQLNQHSSPEVAVWEWGIYLGTRGRKRKHLLLGKDLAERWKEWGAARIPLSLIDKIVVLIPQSFQRVFKTGVLRKIKVRKSRNYVRVNWR